jgi:hypothetical protein
MVMGENGMADMGAMEMPLPDNTLPMMTGTGPFGPLEMGGMFTTLKVRKDQKPGDYSDPGDYAQPPGTQAYEWTGQLPQAQKPPQTPATSAGKPSLELRVKKPNASEHQH